MKKNKGIRLALIIFIMQFIIQGFNPAYYVMAEGVETAQTCETFVNQLNVGSINQPNYSSTKQITDVNTFYSLESAGEYMRKQMVLRKPEITFTIMKYYYSGICNDIYNHAIAYSDDLSSSEGDYLKENFKKYQCSISYTNTGKTTITYKMEYLSTYEQEEMVNKEVKKVLDDLNVYNKDDYTKVKAVHDYIVQNVFYDYDLKRYSAYDAIINGSVVCQGFASLTYKMLRNLGIGVRVITGKTNGGVGHAWNIVKVDGEWYNVDNTWDENANENNYRNDGPPTVYFLKNNVDFEGHNRDSEYKTEEFNQKYPVSSTSYSYEESKKNNNVKIPCDVNGDFKVDALDLAAVANNYNVDSNSNEWNSLYDFNYDNIIDIYDLVMVSSMLVS